MRHEHYHRRGIDSPAYHGHISLEHGIGRTPKCNGILLHPSTVSIAPTPLPGCFVLTRERIIPATICQIIYIPRFSDPNYTLHAFPYSICVQVVQFLSFLAVCIVYFWPFIKSIQGGLERSSDTNMIAEYVLSDRSRSSRARGGTLSRPPGDQRGDRSNYIELTTDSAGNKKERTRASNTDSGVSRSQLSRSDGQ